MISLRKDCLNKEGFKTTMAENKEKKTPNIEGYSNDFKVALAGTMSMDDFKAIEEQFFRRQ